MNTLVIVLIAAVCLFGAYTLYGRWLANKWGIDPKAKTPAVVHEDGRDYVPTNGWTVFAHQFSSIAGAGPVTGAIQAAAFGWLPVLLWVLLGGIFFGSVTDFGALYASVKNDGKSMGMLIEKYIGKTGRKLFLLFCWLFCGIVIAAFADMVAGTFNAYGTDGALVEAAQTNGAAGMVSIMFMVFAVVFGLLQNKFHFTGWKENVISIVFIVLSFVVGANAPVILGKAAWSYITFVYIFFAAVLPMWLRKQPRGHMTTFMFICMIAGAVVGLLVAHPTMNLPVFTGFTNEKLGTMFPILFVTVACGAVSGFHSLVSSGTSSKTVENEKDMLKVGYGAMILESLLAVLRHRYRCLRRHGRRHFQRLRRRRCSGRGCSDQRCCRYGLYHVHGLCSRLWSHPEEVQLLRLEGERHQHCLHRAFLRHRCKPADHSGQGCMELYHLRLHLLCRCSAYVAAEAAP